MRQEKTVKLGVIQFTPSLSATRFSGIYYSWCYVALLAWRLSQQPLSRHFPITLPSAPGDHLFALSLWIRLFLDIAYVRTCATWPHVSDFFPIKEIVCFLNDKNQTPGLVHARQALYSQDTCWALEFFKTGFHSLTRAGLEFSLQPKLVCNLWSDPDLCLVSAGSKLLTLT